ncbi:MAG: cytochrome c oxidase assembly protein, partial [Acidimicrobiales bacterium]
VHMIQHLVLLEVAPLLIVAGQGWRWWPRLHPLLRRASHCALRSAVRLRRRRWSLLGATVLFSTDVWAWHVPYIYDLTLRNQTVHDLEHATFFGVGLTFFAAMLSRDRAAPMRCSERLVLLGLALASMLSLGVLLVTASRPCYQAYAERPRAPGRISALTDQHWSGDIMIFAGMVPLLVAFDVLLYRCLVLPGASRSRPSVPVAERS